MDQPSPSPSQHVSTAEPAPLGSSLRAPHETAIAGVGGNLQRIVGRSRFTLEALLIRMRAPITYQLIGRGCGVCAVFVLIASIGFSALGGSWFTGAILLGLIWFVGEASAAILEEIRTVAEAIQRERK